MSTTEYRERFAGIERLFGQQEFGRFANYHICIVGLGGVGSWAVEALARTGIGRLTLIDFDEISEGNINRQLHALSSTIGHKKHAVMQERVRQINPDCIVRAVDDFLTGDNVGVHLSPDHGFDCVIDAIDSITHKAAMIYYCKRNKIPVIATGGAGGLTDPTQIRVADLSRTYNDALAARVRQRLRVDYGFTRNPKRYFGVECVFSSQHKLYPKADGSVCTAKPGIHGVDLDCRYGYGSASFVTANFGFLAASRAIHKANRHHAPAS
jgi:tRNA A37 threonylcarbamoyladenosine dehydratase